MVVRVVPSPPLVESGREILSPPTYSSYAMRYWCVSLIRNLREVLSKELKSAPRPPIFPFYFIQMMYFYFVGLRWLKWKF
jgi:hypothetical protein